jgi:hypothetical protein
MIYFFFISDDANSWIFESMKEVFIFCSQKQIIYYTKYYLFEKNSSYLIRIEVRG